jgi:uncharacterized membrane protein
MPNVSGIGFIVLGFLLIFLGAILLRRDLGE